MEPKEKALEIDRRLSRAFGNTLKPSGRDLLHELLHAVLSQNTSRRNYELAYRCLTEAFGDVESLAGARLADVERAIRPGGLSRQKSRTIKEIFARIEQERAELSLEFLRNMKVPEARAYLTSLPGVGPKTASVVLMFALGRGVLPVDTHVLRVSKRTGLVDGKTTAEAAEAELEAIVPPKARPRFHLNMVQLGREICHARGPRHERCPIAVVCDLYRLGHT